jgi:hypothetical protein
VEVYELRPDGWCAIRPPAESFSWVYAPHLTVIDSEVAEINKENVAARVGSRLSSQRDVVQVRLRRGEVVQIVGTEDEASTGWYKISPPSGEFRWVHAKNLAMQGNAPKQSTVARSHYDVAVSLAAHETTSIPTSQSGWTPIAAPPLTPIPNTPATTPLDSATTPDTTTLPSGKSQDVAPVAANTPAPGELALQLHELEIQLSRMVAEPMTTWNIESLEQSAEMLLARANSVDERAAVKGTLAKIDRFAGLKRRAASMNESVATFAPSGFQGEIELLAGGAVPVIQGQMATPLEKTAITLPPGSSYDAVGVLRPVVSRRPGAPQFALVDDQGQVVTFVTAPPDTNLQPYLGRRIGISGNRGYIPEFRRPHVTAGRVTPLNERVLR